MIRRVALILACLSGFGCAGPREEVEPLPMGPRARFESRVQPVLAARCASGGCHGRAERPLALYASGAHRADPERTYLDEPLSAFEMEENMRRLSAFALGATGEGSLAVQKPLAVGQGGVWHGGGDVFADRTDPGLIALVGWLDARALDGGVP